MEGGAKVDRARVNNFALERLCQAWMENVRFFFFFLCIDDDFVFLCRAYVKEKRNGRFLRMVETDRCSWMLKRDDKDGFEYFFLEREDRNDMIFDKDTFLISVQQS